MVLAHCVLGFSDVCDMFNNSLLLFVRVVPKEIVPDQPPNNEPRRPAPHTPPAIEHP